MYESILVKKNSENKEIIWKEFVWFKEGTIKDRERKKARHCEITCKGHKANLIVMKTSSNTFVDSLIIKSHNQPLATSYKVHLLRMHWHVSKAKKCLSQ